MISVKNSFEIAYNGTENECRFELYADTAADLQSLTHIDGIKIQMGSECTDISTGDKYLLNGSGVWILQPSDNAWQNVYTKPEIDSMITEIYDIIAYYHTTLVSDTGEITFYALAGYIATWKIYGNGQQTGTPSPQNIVPFDGSGERTGQIIDYTQSEPGGIDSTGNYAPSYNLWRSTVFYDIPVNGLYLSFAVPSDLRRVRVNYYDSTYTHISRQEIDETYGSGIQLTIPANASYFKWTLYSNTKITMDFVKSCYLMFNSGSTVLPYEPYGWAEKITCAGQTVPVYLGQTPTVRMVKKLVLTGDESYIKDSTGEYLYYIYVAHLYHTNCLCSHLASTTGYPTSKEGCSTYNNASIIYLNFGADVMNAQQSGNTVAGLKEYLAAQYAAGTPVTVWYVLAEPQTGIVNEPLCKIGDYADELHSEDAGVQIPTVKGANTLTVDTELQPSLIEISGGYHA